MRTIMVLNPKGGCGKSTIAANLASYYATHGKQVVLADFDYQGSGLSWLAARPAGRPPIKGYPAFEKSTRPTRNVDIVIEDSPAAIHGKELTNLLRRAETFLIPVLPSPVDMRAATNFITELRHSHRISHRQGKFGVIANRAREHTRIYTELEDFLKKLKVPVVGTLRDSMNYVRAEERGLGIFEMAPYATTVDREQWEPIIKWLNSKRSRPSS